MTLTRRVTTVAMVVEREPIWAMVSCVVRVLAGTMISQPGSILELPLAFVTVPF